MNASVKNTNEWNLTNHDEEYLDYERELIGFNDEGSTSIDMRLTFDVEKRAAYIVLLRHNDDGNTRELGDSIPVSWADGCRMIGDLAKTMPLPAPVRIEALSDREVEELVDEALDAACLVIQRKLGQTDGGVAGAFFSDDKHRASLTEYVHEELRHANFDKQDDFDALFARIPSECWAPETDLGYGDVSVEPIEIVDQNRVTVNINEGSQQGEEKTFDFADLSVDAGGEHSLKDYLESGCASVEDYIESRSRSEPKL